jgi:hypothetical protein
MSQQDRWRIFVKKLFRTAILSAMTLLSIQPATLFVRSTNAAAVPKDGSNNKKRKKSKFKPAKFKPRRKEKFLKGHHGKHKARPA